MAPDFPCLFQALTNRHCITGLYKETKKVFFIHSLPWSLYFQCGIMLSSRMDFVHFFTSILLCYVSICDVTVEGWLFCKLVWNCKKYVYIFALVQPSHAIVDMRNLVKGTASRDWDGHNVVIVMNGQGCLENWFCFKVFNVFMFLKCLRACFYKFWFKKHSICL